MGTIYFNASEANMKRQMALPWLSFGSDAEAAAPEGVFLQSGAHPRAYGAFARTFGRIVREDRIIPLEEAIRRMTSQPASNLALKDRGRLALGYFADVVVFDPATVADRATYETPHQLAVGVSDVFVNGVQALAGGEATRAPSEGVCAPSLASSRTARVELHSRVAAG